MDEVLWSAHRYPIALLLLRAPFPPLFLASRNQGKESKKTDSNSTPNPPPASCSASSSLPASHPSVSSSPPAAYGCPRRRTRIHLSIAWCGSWTVGKLEVRRIEPSGRHIRFWERTLRKRERGRPRKRLSVSRGPNRGISLGEKRILRHPPVGPVPCTLPTKLFTISAWRF